LLIQQLKEKRFLPSIDQIKKESNLKIPVKAPTVPGYLCMGSLHPLVLQCRFCRFLMTEKIKNIKCIRNLELETHKNDLIKTEKMLKG